MPPDMMGDDMMGDDSGPLFWSMKVEPGQTVDIDQPAIPNYIVHITNACFGADVNNKSRSVVTVTTTNEDEDGSSSGVPICVLKEGQIENQSLDLLFNESASLSVAGTKPSTVYLTGYIQPPVGASDNLDGLNPMMEDMDEEQIMQAMREQKRQQQGMDSMDEDEDVQEPPAKKQKTAKGAKATANGVKADKKRKQSAPSSDEEEEEVKPSKKGKGKKEMRTLSGNIKCKDMSEGKGKEAKKGDKLRVYYVGQTEDKDVFDKAITGTGFEFTLGKGEVIKGWDVGCVGMKVGGKRKLIIPPKFAYGQEGSPPTIGPNATLTFTIQLKAINGKN